MTLKEFRDAIEWTQKDLAQLLGITPSHLSRLESGQRSVTASTALEIIRRTKGKVTLEDLVGGRKK